MIGLTLVAVGLTFWLVFKREPALTVLLAGLFGLGMLLLLGPFPGRRSKLFALFGGFPAIAYRVPSCARIWAEKSVGSLCAGGVVAGQFVGGMVLGLFGWFSFRGSGWEGVMLLFYDFFGVVLGALGGALVGALYGLWHERGRKSDGRGPG